MVDKPRFDGEWVKLGDVVSIEKMKAKPPLERNWLLNLDAIESNTGNVAMKVRVAPSDLRGSIIPFSSGTVLYSRLRPNLNKVVLADEDGYATSELLPMIADESRLRKEYLAAFLRSKPFVESACECVAGAKMPRISRRDVLAAKIPLPSLGAQRELCNLLALLHGLCSINEQRLAKLDILVKSRFVGMFGDPFDNPLGWDMVALSELGTCKNGMNFRTEESGVVMPCLGVADFKDRSFIKDISILGSVSLNAMPPAGYLLKDGDIVFVRSNGNKELVGRCLAVYPGDEDAIFSGFCIRLRIEDDRIEIPFLLWALKHPSVRRQMFGRGANVQNLNQKILAQVRIPLPPKERQKTFLDFVAQVDKSRFVACRLAEKYNDVLAAIGD